MKKYWLCFLMMALAVGCAKEKKPAQVATPPSKAETPAPAAPVQPPPAAEVAKPAVPTAGEAIDSPTRVIQKYTDELRLIVEPEKATEKGKRDVEKEKQIAEKVRRFFDFEGLARMALGRHWSRITPTQRNEYRELFVSLIEDSYLKKTADIVGDYKIVYKSEEIKGNKAKVASSVARDDADVDINYDLHKNPKDWMIYNITLDNVDLIRNYQTQFNRIIEQSGFNELLAKMRKKKDENDKEDVF